jgi:hypothetical protein
MLLGTCYCENVDNLGLYVIVTMVNVLLLNATKLKV